MKRFSKYFASLRGVKLPWVLIVLSLIFSAAMMNAELQAATLTAGIIDTSQNAIDSKLLTNFIVVTALAALFRICEYYFTRRMEETISLRVRCKLWNKIMHLPTKYYDEDNGNELVSRVTTDAAAPATLFSMIVSFTVCVFTVIKGFIQLFDYNTLLASWSLLIIPMTAVICLIYGKLTYKLGVYTTVTMAGSLGYLAERVRSFRLIKSAVAEKVESEKGSGNFKRMYVADFLNWIIVAGYQLAASLFSILFIVVVFVIGGQLMQKGELTIGDLTSFYMICGIVGIQLMQFFMNVGSVSGTFGTMQKINKVSDCEAESEDGRPVPQLCADIVFDKVSFGYFEDNDVLKDVSVTIPAGKVTAIVGGNGAGKSTMFKLITRLYEPKSGEIRFNGENAAEYELGSWRGRFAYVFQRDGLIGGSVRDNIVYGLEREVSEEEIIAAAKSANCYDFIMEKPAGFDEDVGLGGSNFSGGQGQCICIARAMLRNADILLLDEATSNLDVTSTALVSEAMDNLMKNRTTVMIAHSFAATKNADYVIVMREGTVEAAGTPDELEKTNEYYKLFSKSL